MSGRGEGGAMHLAQLNIGRIRFDADDPRMADFMDNLDRVNALAERSRGFVWRLTDDGTNNATSIAIGGDARLIPNLSVWESLEDLERFVFRTVHSRFYARRAAWFEPPREAHFVMWRVPAGWRPTLDEALDRLDSLRRDGPSERAFGWEALSALPG